MMRRLILPSMILYYVYVPFRPYALVGLQFLLFASAKLVKTLAL